MVPCLHIVRGLTGGQTTGADQGCDRFEPTEGNNQLGAVFSQWLLEEFHPHQPVFIQANLNTKILLFEGLGAFPGWFLVHSHG